jgi:mono/diheme cytochrome c family protein
MSRLFWFLVGVIVTIGVLVAGGYLFLVSGGVSMATTASPLPLEKRVARIALHASYGKAAQDKDPLPVTESNLVQGADIYRTHCAICHSLPGQPHNAIARGMFPGPPELFAEEEMVTDDPEGVTYWKVTHGIRLSGMPGFGQTLSDVQRWQVTMLVAHADKLPSAARTALRQASE